MRKTILLLVVFMQLCSFIFAASGSINLSVVQYPTNSSSGIVDVTWTSSGASSALLCVQINNNPETVMHADRSGIDRITWINPRNEYTFRLYEMVGGQKVKILAEEEYLKGELHATMISYPSSSSNGVVNLQWSSVGSVTAQLWCKVDDQAETVLNPDASLGDMDFTMAKGHKYTFILYSSSSAESKGRARVLDQVELPAGDISVSLSQLENNPVNARAQVSWSSVGCTHTQLWVKTGTSCQLIACNRGGGSITADWINKNGTYTFQLYGLTSCSESTDDGVLLKELTIPTSSLSMAVNSTPKLGTPGQLTLNWNATVGYPNTQIGIVSEDGTEQLGYCSSNTSDSHTFSTEKDNGYIFRLYGANDCSGSNRRLMNEITLPTGNLEANVVENNNTLIRSIDLNWTSRLTPYTQVWMKKGSGGEEYLARTTTAGTVATDLEDGAGYTFKLYAATGVNVEDRSYLLDEVVIGNGSISASTFSFASDGTVSSTISWNAASTAEVQVYIQEEEGDEALIYSGTQLTSSVLYSNLEKGKRYSLKLYGAENGVKGLLLDKITVPFGSIEASMYAIPATNGSFCTAHLKWSAAGYPYTLVTVQVGSGTEKAMSCSYSTGSSNPNWVKKGSDYTFRLYASTGCSMSSQNVLLDEIKIRAINPLQKMVGVNKSNLLFQYSGMSSGVTSAYPSSKDVVKRLAQKSITDAKELGFGYMRVMVSYFSGSDLNLWLTNKNQYFQYVDEMLADMDANGMKIVPVLNFNAKQFADRKGESVYELFINPESQSKLLLAEFISDFVNRYKNRSTILFWELANEANNMLDLPYFNNSGTQDKPKSLLSTDVWKVHMKWMCDEIRKHDRLHMISSGNSIVRPYAWNLWKNNSWESDTYTEFKNVLFEQNRYCDIVSIHEYYNTAGHFGYSGSNYYDYLTEVASTVNGFNKLLYIGEFGDRKTLQNPSTPEPIAVLDKIQQNNIPFASVWSWEFYNKSTYAEDDFCVDPSYSHDLVDKMIEVNAAFGNPQWLPEENDLTAPKVILSYPFSNSPVAEDVNIWTKASDNNRYIDRIELYVDGVLQNSTADFPFRNLLEVEGLEESMHKIEVLAYDEEQNASSDCIMLYKGVKRPHRPSVSQAANPDRLIVSWDDCYVGSSVYTLEKKTNNGEFAVIGTINGDNSYTDYNVVDGAEYEYRITSSLVSSTPSIASVPRSLSADYGASEQETETLDEPLAVYPNPVSDELHVENIEPGTKVSLFDPLGLCVYQTVSATSELTIDVSSLQTGIYVVDIKNSSDVYSYQIMKK